MDPVTASHVARVVLTGSESVGKTTLAAALAAHYGVEVVPEFVRTFAAQKRAPIDFSDHGVIARGQMALEDEHLARAGRLLIQDTDLVSTVVYCEHYFGRCPAFILDAARTRRGDLYLLPDLDVPWVADGIRDRGDRREEMQQLFVDRLAALGANVVAIRGTADARLAEAVRAVDALLATRAAPIPSPRP